jgi:DNA-directed RNA polymerase specialized sigma24 family protein
VGRVRGTVSVTVTHEVIRRALAGDRSQLRAIVDGLTPVIQARVARVLLRAGAVDRRGSVRQEVEDLSQEIFCRLFAQQGEILRSWDERKGMSLAGYVGLIAEREAISIVRSRRRNPFTERPTEAGTLDLNATQGQGAETAALTRQMARTLYERLQKTLSPLGFSVFEKLFCHEQAPESVCEELGMSADALYAWRSRIRKTARSLADELAGEGTISS